MHPTEGTIDIQPLQNTKAFEPIKVGEHTLSNRIVFAPSTRFRTANDHDISDLQLQYYDERSRDEGTLIIAEGTLVSERTGMVPQSPGIWSKYQVEGWKKIVDKVHENKSLICCQLYAPGRVSNAEYMKKKGVDIISPSGIPFSGNKEDIEKFGTGFREPSTEELKAFIYEDFTNAVKNAVEAGFDYIEIHSLFGYFLDLMLQSNTNQRTDQYGGSIENRASYLLEILDNVIPIAGAQKLGVRLSPWSRFQDMKGIHNDVLPYDQFSYVFKELQKRADQGNELAYISIAEPRVEGSLDVKVEEQRGSNDFLYDIWKGIVMRAGNYSHDAPGLDTLRKDLENGRTLIAFSRYFLSNPDLVNRLRNGYPLVPHERDTFYTYLNYGYNTFSMYGEDKVVDEVKENGRMAQPLV